MAARQRQREVRLAAALTALAAVAALLVAVPPSARAATVQRLAGSDRFATAAAVSAATHQPGVPVAYVATGGDFPDALAGAPVARANGGPILLVTRDSVPPASRSELDRLKAGRIVILGGPGAVSDAVAVELGQLTTGGVSRLAGADRYATATAISASTYLPGVGVVYVVTGAAFPDGLAAGATGAFTGGPVLLVTPGSIPGPTAAELQRLRPGSITVVGGTNAVSAVVEQQLRSYSGTVGRASGADRYATASSLSANSYTAPRATVVLATGASFADALAGGPAAGVRQAPLLLVAGSCVPRTVLSEINRLQPQTLVILGGPQAVSPAVESLTPCPALAEARVRLTRVAGLAQPVALAVRPNDGALYVAEKTGRVRAVRNGAVDPVPVFDLTGQVSLGNEQGLLGLAFSPDGVFLYVNYTDTGGDTQVVEVVMVGGQANAATRRVVLSVAQPYANHNGGHLAFGPDGHLYIGLGDGGDANDPENRAQNLTALLGKMLRISPRPAGGQPYGIPAGNPFAGRADARAEIWAYGLRNPWRYSFDRLTGDLWIGDVGQSAREEVDLQAAGAGGGQNYGWARMEGTVRKSGSVPANHVPPIFEYPTGDGCAITGGFVYRGARIPDLSGAYVYADHCNGRVRALRQEGGRVVETKDLAVETSRLSSFGQDHAGELYVLSLGGDLRRLDPA